MKESKESDAQKIEIQLIAIFFSFINQREQTKRENNKNRQSSLQFIAV